MTFIAVNKLIALLLFSCNCQFCLFEMPCFEVGKMAFVVCKIVNDHNTQSNFKKYTSNKSH